RLDVRKHGLLDQSVPPRFPVVTQMEALTSIHGGHKFERIEGLATGVDLLEHQTNGRSARILPESNHRQMVLGEIVDYLLGKLVNQLHMILASFHILQHPCERVLYPNLRFEHAV